MHARFGAARFHGHGVMEEMDGLTHTDIFTSITEGEGGYVFTTLCLSTGYIKRLWMDPDEIW